MTLKVEMFHVKATQIKTQESDPFRNLELYPKVLSVD